MAGPTILSRIVKATDGSPPLRLACMGAGGQGAFIAMGLPASAKVVAFCDVDDARAAPVYARHPLASLYKRHALLFEDMQNKIDAVTIATPDHTHFSIAEEALRRKRHVYCEAPLAHTVWQSRRLLELAESSGCVLHLAGSPRARVAARHLERWLRAISTGTVVGVTSWSRRRRWAQGMAAWPERQTPPGTLDWDAWQHGLSVPYSPAFHPVAWRGWQAFGLGELGDSAFRIMEATWLALAPRLPVRLHATTSENSSVAWPGLSRVQWTLPLTSEGSSFSWTWNDGKEARPEPSRHRPDSLPLPASGTWIECKLAGALIEGETSRIRFFSDGAPVEPESDPTASPHDDEPDDLSLFIQRCRMQTQHPPPFQLDLVRLSETLQLGAISQRLPGEILAYDPIAGFRNNPSANRLVRFATIP